MKLNGSFFEIISAEKQEPQQEGALQGTDIKAAVPRQTCYRIRLNPEHEIYKAHFPEQPITPGVIIVRMAMELLSEALGRKAHLVAAPNIKFSAPLFPQQEPDPAERFLETAQNRNGGKEVDFNIIIKEEEMASVTVMDAKVTFSKMLIRYE